MFGHLIAALIELTRSCVASPLVLARTWGQIQSADHVLDIAALDDVAQAQAALAARRHAFEQRHLVEWQRRVARRQRQDSYPPNAVFETLTPAQQAERLDVAAELLR